MLLASPTTPWWPGPSTTGPLGGYAAEPRGGPPPWRPTEWHRLRVWCSAQTASNSDGWRPQLVGPGAEITAI
jgi:hypothetical protein